MFIESQVKRKESKQNRKNWSLVSNSKNPFITKSNLVQGQLKTRKKFKSRIKISKWPYLFIHSHDMCETDSKQNWPIYLNLRKKRKSQLGELSSIQVFLQMSSGADNMFHDYYAVEICCSETVLFCLQVNLFPAVCLIDWLIEFWLLISIWYNW